MSNYGHIVYAGGRNGITLKGTPNNMGGYQIVDVSRNMTDSSILYDADFVEHVIKFPCTNKPAVKDDVECYLYGTPETGASLLVRLANRGLDRLEDIEDTIGFKRRSSINEAIVDIHEVYPCQLIGSPIFSALNVDPREYYRQQSPNPQENVDFSQIPMGPVTREEALRFAQQHEQEVRKLVYYLLDQLSRAPAERRAVAIRDTEPNVRLWVAAATYSMPLRAALQVSFNTRVVEIARPQVQLIYGVQKSDGKLVKDYNIQNPNLEQRLCAMIIGADPDSFSEVQLKQKTPNKPFITLSEIEAPDIAFPYFTDMVTNDDKIQSFNECLLDLQNCPCDLTLARVYTAYCTLSSKQYHAYDKIEKSLDIMAPFFTDKSYLLCYIVDQTTNSILAGNGDTAIDSVICKLIPLLPIVHDVDVKERFENALGGYLGASITNFQNLEGCIRIAKSLSGVTEIAKRVFVSSIENTVLGKESTAAFVGSASEMDILRFLSILEIYRQAADKKWAALLQSGDYTVASVVQKVAASEKLTNAFLSILGNDTLAVDTFMLEGIKAVGLDKNQHIKWWLNMISHNVSLRKICELIAQSGEKEIIEAILCVQIRQHGQTREIQEQYSKYLANDPNAGSDYYNEWMRSLSKDTDRLKGIKDILTSLESNHVQGETYKKVLCSLDEEVSYQNTRENEQQAELITQFASRAKMYCPNSEVFVYLKNMTGKSGSLFKAKKESPIDTYFKYNGLAQTFAVRDGFSSSKMCEEYIDFLLEAPEEAAVYIILASSFIFSSTNEEKAYYSAVADCVCTLFLKKHSLSVPTLIYAIDCLSEGDAMSKDVAARIIEKMDKANLLRELNYALHACEEKLCEEKTDNIADKALAETSKRFGSKTAKHLEQIFKRAQEQYQKSHKGGFFGKLFGKK